MRVGRLALVALAILVLLPVGYYFYSEWIGNPRVVRELVQNPQGELAKRVMLITLPSGRRIPVNYLREGDRIYAGADGSWWKELVGDGFGVTLLVRGETLRGRARAVLDDPEYRAEIFSRLRPNAIEGFGTLVEIDVVDGGGTGGSTREMPEQDQST